MSPQLVECVPNFSEGRDRARMKLITGAIESVSGVRLMDVDPGADTNRTVVTFVGDPEGVLEAAFRAVKKASEVIDMRSHHGAHPRMGACDVCPFVPVEGVTLEDCAELARRLGARVGQELGLPVYLYEAAASRPERQNLAVVRKGEYEGLEEKLKDPLWRPDFGPAIFAPTFGALITGAREFLIAYNITLNSRDKAHATDIAFELREKGRVARRGQTDAFYASGKELMYAEGFYPCGNCDFDGGTFEALETHCREAHRYDLRHLLQLNDIDLEQSILGRKAYRAGRFRACKAIGWYVETYKRAQLSINLTDYKTTGPADVLEAARGLAAERGLVVTGSEIVGLVPFQALYQTGQQYLRRQGKSPFVPVPDVLENAVFSLGLSDVAPFEMEQKVLGLPRTPPDSLLAKGVREFADEVSRDTPAPGGGSIAALAGALAAALASMVANLTRDPEHQESLMDIAQRSQRVKDELLLAVDEDTRAFNAYMEARRLPSGTPQERADRQAAMQEGLKEAARVPLATAKACLEAMACAVAVVRDGNPASVTDGLTGVQMGFAGLRGGLWNVRVNLKDIRDAAYGTEMRCLCAQILGKGEVLLEQGIREGEARLEALQDQ